MDHEVLTVVFTGTGPVRKQVPNLEQGSLFVPIPDPAPQVPADLVLCLVTDSGRVEVAARVVQLIPGAGVALVFEDAAKVKAELGPLVEQAEAADGDGHEDEGTTEVFWGRRPAKKRAVEPKDAGTLQSRVRAMTSSEKMQLALHGDRAARLVLMKDTNKMVHTFVIQNSRITLDEVRYMAGSRQCNPDVLQVIAKNREWVQNPRIVSALVRNPKTPTTTAIRMIDKLPVTELRVLAKSTSVSRAIQMAARKKVVG